MCRCLQETAHGVCLLLNHLTPTIRTTLNLNSGIRLMGSSALPVSMFAASRLPQWNGANSVSGRMSGVTSAANSTFPPGFQS